MNKSVPIAQKQIGLCIGFVIIKGCLYISESISMALSYPSLPHKSTTALFQRDQLLCARGVDGDTAVKVLLRRAHLDRHAEALQHLPAAQP